MQGLIDLNLTKFEEIQRTQPRATHIYIRRNGEDGAVIDIPLRDVITTIKRNPMWEIVSSNETMDADVAELFKDPSL